MRIKKGVVIADFHHPYEDKKIVKLYVDFLNTFKPDELVINGDFLNYAAYNRHGKRKNEVPNERISEDHTSAIITLDKLPLGKIKHKVWLDGNHEINQDDYFMEFPDYYDDAIHRYNKLKLIKRGFKEILPYKKSYKSGKLHFTHGWRAGVNAVRDHLIKDYKASFVMGHIHKSDTATSTNIEENIMQGYAIGCSSQLDFRYSRHPTSNHGFGVYYMLPNGNFQFYNIVIINYKFIFEGQVWGI